MKNAYKEQTRKVLDIIGKHIHTACKDFAISKMNNKDFILITDANGKTTNGIEMRIDDAGVDETYTIKKSSKEKFDEYYYNKLEHLLKNMLKDNG